jgi:hypothetical protein
VSLEGIAEQDLRVLANEDLGATYQSGRGAIPLINIGGSGQLPVVQPSALSVQ